jgi:SAM-dependent methyltransferase
VIVNTHPVGNGTMPRTRCPKCRAPLTIPAAGTFACGRCAAAYAVVGGIPSLLPGSSDPNLRRRYEEMATSSEDPARTVGYRSNRQHALMVAAFREILRDLPADRRLLDVGCGHGGFSETFARNHVVVGVDIALGMLRLARERGLVPFHADATALPFEDHQFDVTLSAEVIQHFDDLRPSFAEMARVTRTGGKLVVSTLSAQSALRRMFRLVRGIRADASSTEAPLLRTSRDLLDAIRGLPLAPERFVWTHYPVGYLATTDGPDYALAPLSTNVVVVLSRQPDA